MFFLIRTVFWLSVVFSSMAWTSDGSQQNPHALRDAVVESGMSLVGSAKDAAIDQAKTWCVKQPERCMADAAQLTALVVASQTDDKAVGSDADPVLAASLPQPTVLPVPVANPHRHGASKGLTRQP